MLKLLLTFEIFFTRTRNFSLPGTEKQKKWCAYNQFHLTIPLFMDVFFVAAFFCQVAIFWLKTVQFSSQKCNEFSGRNLIAIFEHKPEKIFKTTQNATLPLYLFCLSKKFSKACFSLSFFLPLIYSYKSWYKNDPKKGEY